METSFSSEPFDSNKRKRGIKNSLQFKEYNPQGSGYADRITEDQWLEHRPLLEQLHLQNCSRAEMRAELEEHDFNVSLPQLNNKMNKWGYRVYENHKVGMKSAVDEQAAPIIIDEEHTTGRADGDVNVQISNASGLATFDFEAFGEVLEPEDIPLPDCEISETNILPEAPPSNDHQIELSLPVYIQALQNSDTVTQLQSIPDWLDFVFDQVDNDPALNDCTKSNIYKALADLLIVCRRGDEGLYFQILRYSVIKDVMSACAPNTDEALRAHHQCLRAIHNCLSTIRQTGNQDLYSNMFHDFLETIGSSPDDQVSRIYVLSALIPLLEIAGLFGYTHLSKKTQSYMDELQISLYYPMYGDRKILGKMGSYIKKFLDTNSRIRAQKLERVQIQWNMDSEIVQDLLFWCRKKLHSIQELSSATKSKLPHELLHENQPLRSILCFYLLVQWYNDIREVSADEKRNLSVIRGVKRRDCSHCIRKVIRKLATISLLITSEVTSLSLREAMSYQNGAADHITIQRLLSAIDNIQTMRSSEMQLVYYEARKKIFDSPSGLCQTSESDRMIGKDEYFVTAFVQYLIALCKAHKHDTWEPCGNEETDSNSTEEKKIGSSLNGDSGCSVSSMQSSLLGSMRRMKKRLKRMATPSIESFGEFICHTMNSQTSLNLGILSSKMSFLSVKSADTRSMVSNTSKEGSESSASSG